jgi:hypothetical protein
MQEDDERRTGAVAVEPCIFEANDLTLERHFCEQDFHRDI